jgi:putative restriction endonuclease
MSSDLLDIIYYLEKFRKLRKDRSVKKYPALMRHSAPHKPLLLLSVIDLFTEGSISSNLITLNPELGALFDSYWLRVMPTDWYGNIGLPFYYLASDDFWYLQPRPGSEMILQVGRRLTSIRQLHDHTLGATLYEALFHYLQNAQARDLLRTTLIETHFDAIIHAALLEQGHTNLEAFAYSQQLLSRVVQEAKVSRHQEPPEPVRNQGFRRAVTKVYDNRCSVCGLRVQTLDSHTAVDAAHIVPWSVSHNDDIRNGMALCKLCHWVFDKGLIAVTKDFTVRLSKELTADYNLPGYLMTLKGREIIGPQERLLWPDIEALAWHLKHRFRS